MASPAALRIHRWVAVAAGVGLFVTAAACGAAALTKRPLPGAGLLLGVVTPFVFGGLLWTIAVLIARTPTGGTRRNPRTFFFGALPAQVGQGLLGAFVVGWLAAVAAFPGLSLGTPIPGTPRCPSPVLNEGVVTCVPDATYQEARAARQQFTAGVVMSFFVVHFGVALNELVRRADGDGRLRPIP